MQQCNLIDECTLVPSWECGSQHVTTCPGLITNKNISPKGRGQENGGYLKGGFLVSDQKPVLRVARFQNQNLQMSTRNSKNKNTFEISKCQLSIIRTLIIS